MKCPSFELLIDHLDGGASAAGDGVGAHLRAGCESCGEDRNWYLLVKGLANGDDSVQPPSWVTKRAVSIFDQRRRKSLAAKVGGLIAKLAFDSTAQPLIAGVRSAATQQRQLLYQAGDYSVDLQVATSGGAISDVTGQVLRGDEALFESVARRPMTLTTGSRTVLSAKTNERGEFTIQSIEPGEYELRFDLSGTKLTIPGLLFLKPGAEPGKGSTTRRRRGGSN